MNALEYILHMPPTRNAFELDRIQRINAHVHPRHARALERLSQLLQLQAVGRHRNLTRGGQFADGAGDAHNARMHRRLAAGQPKLIKP